MEMVIRSFVIFLFFFLISCATEVTKEEAHAKAQELLSYAQALETKNRKPEALKIYLQLQNYYPQDKEVKEAILRLRKETKGSLSENPYLGMNTRLRVEERSSIVKKILWYIPDRILDLFDIFDIWIHIGPQIGFRAKGTSVFQATWYHGNTTSFGFGNKKQWGVKVEEMNSFTIFPLGVHSVSNAKVGSGGFQYAEDTIYLHSPKDSLYQEYEDYWGFHGQGGVLLIGVEFQFHPLELLDFVSGFFFWDMLGDDVGLSRKLDYTVSERYAQKDFSSIVNRFNKEELAEYKKKFPQIKME